MDELVAVEHRESVGHGDAVVRAEGRPVGGEKAVLFDEADAVFISARAFRRADIDHVRVALQNDRHALAAGLGRRLADDDVVALVAHTLQMPLLGKTHEPVGDRFFVAAAARDL